MSDPQAMPNRVRARRLSRGWSQLELAERAGISRTAVSAIEAERLVPSVAAALALAEAFECSVENLFGPPADPAQSSGWAWAPRAFPCRYWHADVNGRTLFYPVETIGPGIVPHDGVCVSGVPEPSRSGIARQTLVIACCDPAAGFLGAELARVAGIRLLVLPRSSGAALELLARGLVHAAGVHLAASDQRDGNAGVVHRAIGPGKRLLRVARWEEGLTLAPSVRVRSVQSVLRSRLTWVGREPGSGARQCLDALLHDRASPRRIAYDHRGVAEAIRCGWAQVGVCVRLVSAEAGQQFLSVREEAYDLCYTAESERDPHVQALVRVVRSTPYRRAMAELPGYSTVDTGEIQAV